ncbi:GAF and ANTAR domain-containing protein [Curtobacterium sp. VKM Ac-1376]|uniref:GAF and ANTAR domain-containing protein n=1 Tax=Curtobacterium sp. VKM Ac-1376 TaxID=123312 RepID=UPI001889CA5F|nr:GAF and ANTAR domain-containing protein [Curtobacterium sp. VKM Ac-1376]MBF4613019.1 GAF and ANTAR domain-containing protein [Curtobacterium sp. VKM Ac-1376]
MTDATARAFRAFRSTDLPDAAVSTVFESVLRVGGVSVASFGSLLPSETVSATDTVAARVDDIQFDLAEGPCWTALELRSPAGESDFVDHPGTSWPAFADAVRREPVRAVFAFPIVFGPFPLGAVDIYAEHPTALDDRQIATATTLTAALGRRVLRRALHSADDDGALLDRGPYSRRAVHQATGVVLAQLNITPDDAHLLIQGHAFARRTTMRVIAEEIVSGAVRFERRGGLIEHVR